MRELGCGFVCVEALALVGKGMKVRFAFPPHVVFISQAEFALGHTEMAGREGGRAAGSSSKQ